MMSIFVSLQLCILLLLLSFASGGTLKQEDASSCIEKERQALLDVKASLIDVNGFLNDLGSKGDDYTDCCKWMGVQCNNHTGHVIELDLASNFNGNLKGKISPSLQVLSQLQYLNLDDIDFQFNPLPDFLGSMSNVKRLTISNANLSGPIPHQLANLSKLLFLDLSYNSLSGFIPFSFGDLTSLTYLNLAHNQLEGVISKSFGNHSSLEHLILARNHLNGSLPNFVGCSSLITVNLAHNFFSGRMPNFTGCTSLTTLHISNNFLIGSMSNTVDQLSDLYTLDVFRNFLNGSMSDLKGCTSLSVLDMSSNKFSGKVPFSLGQLSKLTYLNLSSNSLEGVISDVHFLDMTQLRVLDLSFNTLMLDLSSLTRIPSQLDIIILKSCKLGPRFPKWLKTQGDFAYLDISNAGIHDNMPEWFWNLPSELQYLNISSNEIKSIIPNLTTNFVLYPVIDLSNNRFEGRVPFLSFGLLALSLSGNKFSGTLSFLCGIREITTFIDLSNNSFSGTLPNCWSNFRKLFLLNLSNNKLSGKIPSSLGFLTNLQALYLKTNAFVGELPMSLSNCTKLRIMDVGENKLSGVIPKFIGENLSKLYVLVLRSNRFYGTLPSQVCWLHNLQVLDVSNNRLSGNIPHCFANFTSMAKRRVDDSIISSRSYYGVFAVYHSLTIQVSWSDIVWVIWKGTKRSFKTTGLQLVKSIDLSRNNLSGKLPDEITSLYELVSLNLSSNQLHGEVPKDIGRLTSLESLDLSRNEFCGHIPWSLTNITFLSYLNLSFNNLSGRIPTGPQLQRFDRTSYNGNPQLYGPPLTPIYGFPPPSGKKDVEEDEDDSWKSYYTGMGAGFAVGFWGICGLLFLNRRCRYLFFASLSHMKDWIYVKMVVHFGKLKRMFDP